LGRVLIFGLGFADGGWEQTLSGMYSDWLDSVPPKRSLDGAPTSPERLTLLAAWLGSLSACVCRESLALGFEGREAAEHDFFDSLGGDALVIFDG
jgi:hypothetical protein